MADFKIAFDITGIIEGQYANNINDKGGETVFGISRKFWPNWPGWVYIDEIKKTSHSILDINHAITQSIYPFRRLKLDFYKQNFWDINKLDQVNDQQVANNVYDIGVNSGVGTAAKMLQKAVGVVADGIIGSKTIVAVNEDSGHVIFDALNIMRREYYLNISTKPNQHQFLKSWLSRLIDYKS